MNKTFKKLLLLVGVLCLLGAGEARAWNDDDLFFRGDQFGWNDFKDINHFTKNADGTYTLHLDYLLPDKEFKIGSENWKYAFGWTNPNNNNDRYVIFNNANVRLTNDHNNLKTPSELICDVTITVTILSNNQCDAKFTFGSGYAVYGQVKTSDWTPILLTQSNSTNWEAFVTPNNNQGELLVVYYENGVIKQWFKTSDTTSIKPNTTKNLSTSYNNNVRFENLATGGSACYIFSWNGSTFSINNYLPEALYLYGDLKGGSWEEDDYYFAPSNNGIYNFTDVSIGRNGGDNNNYIAFFANFDKTDNNTVDYESMLPRYGGDPAQKGSDGYNVTIGPDNYNKNIIAFTSNNDITNYIVNAGMYDITVDLNNGTITFTPVDFAFEWHGANKEIIDGNNHETQFGRDNKIILGARGNSSHEATQHVDYAVAYEPLSSNSGNGVKARATDVSNQEEYYTMNGNEMTLNKLGVYTVTPTLKEGMENTYQVASMPTLTVTVQAGTATLITQEQSTSFTNETQDYTFSSALVFDANLEDTDFTLTIKPENDGEGWATATSNDASEYEAELPKSLFVQYQDAAQGAKHVDGFYTGSSATANGANGNFDLTCTLPCSGVYELTISPAEGSNYTFEAKTVTVTINPNIQLMYGDTPGFNINGITLTIEDTGNISTVMSYPVDQADHSIPFQGYGQSFAYTPGLYFATSLTFDIEISDVTDDQDNSDNVEEPLFIKRNADDYDENAYYGGAFDLTGMTSKTTANITARVTKNGATSELPFFFTVDENTETGVEGIEAEGEGEAVYYNLQGVRVMNPEKGIYIKIINGKAIKIVM